MDLPPPCLPDAPHPPRIQLSAFLLFSLKNNWEKAKIRKTRIKMNKLCKSTRSIADTQEIPIKTQK